jgi:uncharacterized delta-60 repeat protein
MKKLFLLFIFLVAAVPTVAQAAGEPEYEFGYGGRVLTPIPLRGLWSEVSVHMAQAPGGDIFVGSGGEVAGYLPAGQLDTAFGREGLLRIALPSVSRFAIGDLSVDSGGRIVVVGTATRVGARGAARNEATILRYLPDGEPDPGFGGGDGIAMIDFGLRGRAGEGSGAVVASFGAVDEQDRITVVAGTVQSTGSCGQPRRLRRHDRLIARFSADGRLDPSFGRGGVQNVQPLQTVSGMSLDRGGGVVLAGSLLHPCSRERESAVLRFRSDGRRRRSFGPRGMEKLTGAVASIAIDRRDRVTILCKEKQNPRARDEHFTKLVRFLPDGRLDPSFHENGLVVYISEGPLYKWSNLLVAPDGRLLLTGTLIRPLPEKKQHRGQLFHRWFMVTPLAEDGGHTGYFGSREWIEITRFNPLMDAAATDALIDREGELLMAGTARGRGLPRGGFALARFELWH